MGVSTATVTDADFGRLFKIKYGPKSAAKWLLSNPVTNLMKHVYDFTGKEMRLPNPMSLNASASTGVIPHYNRPKIEDMVITRKKAYAITEIDRMTLKAGSADSYLEGMKGNTEGGVEAFSNNWERMLAGDGSGKLGTIKSSAGVTDVGSGVYDVIISDATWVLANWEYYDIVNVGSGSSALFTVENITPSTKTIRLQRFSGEKVPLVSDPVFKQNAENQDLMGFAGATDNSGTKYGIANQYRWQSVRTDAASQAVGSDLLEAHSTEFQVNRGKAPTHFFLSYQQFGRLKQTHEQLKSYVIPRTGSPKDEKMNALLSWTGVTFLTSDGAALVLPWRFCPPDKIYSAYMPDCSSHQTPGGPEWVDEDGSVWKSAERPKDAFYAYYATYGENVLPPGSVGVIHSLAIP